MGRHIFALVFVGAGYEKAVKPAALQFLAELCRAFDPEGRIDAVVIGLEHGFNVGGGAQGGNGA